MPRRRLLEPQFVPYRLLLRPWQLRRAIVRIPVVSIQDCHLAYCCRVWADFEIIRRIVQAIGKVVVTMGANKLVVVLDLLRSCQVVMISLRAAKEDARSEERYCNQS